MNISTTEWTPLTEDMYPALNESNESYWLAAKVGSVFRGKYHWSQGWNPDEFLIDNWTIKASEITHIMRMVVPNPPQQGE